jgi:hypothetical protein
MNLSLLRHLQVGLPTMLNGSLPEASTFAASFCSQHNGNCFACMQSPGCGFCAASSTCLAVDATAANTTAGEHPPPHRDGSCPSSPSMNSSSWIVEASQCPDYCKIASSCSQCLLSAHCSWCKSTCTCLHKSLALNGSEPESATLEGANYCPLQNLTAGPLPDGELCSEEDQGASCAGVCAEAGNTQGRGGSFCEQAARNQSVCSMSRQRKIIMFDI